MGVAAMPAEDEATEVEEPHPHDVLLDFEAPQPPKGTTQEDYEFKVAIWRIRQTDGLKAILRQVRSYESAEERRHDQLISAIEGRGKAFVAFWGFLTTGMKGGGDILKAMVSNENGQMKWVTLALVAIVAIVYGVGFSSSIFSTEVPTKCGRGTVEHEGRCEVIQPEASPAEPSPGL